MKQQHKKGKIMTMIKMKGLTQFIHSHDYYDVFFSVFIYENRLSITNSSYFLYHLKKYAKKPPTT